MMNLLSILKEGTIVMFIGMAVVFFFLVLMTITMKITSSIILNLNKIFPEELEKEKSSSKSMSVSNEKLALAIAIAKRYR